MEKKVILVVLVLLLVAIYTFNFVAYKEIFLSPPNLPIPSDCSDASIKAIWDAIFQEPSTGITILSIGNGSDSGKCNEYLGYKINGETLHLLIGHDRTTIPQVKEENYIVGVKGDFLPPFLTTIQNLPSEEITTVNLDPEVLLENSTQREIQTIAEANLEFVTDFKSIPSVWSEEFSVGVTFFTFVDSITTEPSINSSVGVIVGNYTVNQYTFEEWSYLNLSGECSPDWTATNTSCYEDETYTVYYEDLNQCTNATGMPSNETHGCDFDDDGIIGDEGEIVETNIDIDVYINGIKINDSNTTYNSIETVEFKDGSTTRVEFSHDFSSSPLNLIGVNIEKQTSSDTNGRLFVNGLETDKTLTVDKLIPSSSEVCVKDASTSSISLNCDETNELLINCDGSSQSGFVCGKTGSTFTISGLMHSGVQEYSNGSCLPDWDCTAWSECSDDEKTRVCTDSNQCNSTSGRPPEIEECESCLPDWDCTAWSPTKCPKDKEQTRICTDLNDCGTNEGKLDEEKSCIYKSNIWIWVWIILGIILLVGVVLLIIFFMKRKGSSNPIQQPQTQYSRRPSRPGPPITQTYPRQFTQPGFPNRPKIQQRSQARPQRKP
jgi:hypothetical protein